MQECVLMKENIEIHISSSISVVHKHASFHTREIILLADFLNLVEMWEFHIQISSTPQCHCILLKKYGSDILSLSRVKVCQFRLFHSWISFITQWCLNTETFHKLLILSNRVIVVNSKSAISQPYHGESMFHLDQMMMMKSTLY